MSHRSPSYLAQAGSPAAKERHVNPPRGAPPGFGSAPRWLFPSPCSQRTVEAVLINRDSQKRVQVPRRQNTPAQAQGPSPTDQKARAKGTRNLCACCVDMGPLKTIEKDESAPPRKAVAVSQLDAQSHSEMSAMRRTAAEVLYAQLLLEPAKAAAVAACVHAWKHQPDWARRAAETLFDGGLLFPLDARIRASRTNG